MLGILSAIMFGAKELVFLVSFVKNNAFPQPLSKEEERKYLKLKEEGDEEAGKVLIEHNLRLVAHIAKKYSNKQDHNRHEDSDDLISIGTVGLIKAIDTYNSEKGVKLATYAARCIQNEILMYLRQKRKISGDTSLQDPIGADKEGNEINLLDILGSDAELVHDEVELKMDIKTLLSFLDVLDERERMVIEHRFGLNHKELTQRQIADQLKISRSYVSRIETRALNKLRHRFIKQSKEQKSN